ncbi:MAG: phosphate signaling complex protein PhoU [Coriobacteriia bacterium]|nr:phosphate signaling complex protein PhoU [Coriobacteriia bacterium]
MSPRMHFDEQLEQLDREVLKMGALVERALKGAAAVFTGRDRVKPRRVINDDVLVNRKERDIESLCFKLLLQQQPVARDLRVISSVLKMITDLERIGDQAADICRIALDANPPWPIERMGHLPQLAEAATAMVRGALDAFVKKDVGFVHEVMLADSEVDRLYALTRRELIELIRTDENISEVALEWIIVAKYLERIGDHAQNFAEWVEYSLTGILKGEALG